VVVAVSLVVALALFLDYYNAPSYQLDPAVGWRLLKDCSDYHSVDDCEYYRQTYPYQRQLTGPTTKKYNQCAMETTGIGLRFALNPGQDGSSAGAH
jgi:hypothetical protein